eukprot:2860325-Alexandrium_andersonii.AAC.1
MCSRARFSDGRDLTSPAEWLVRTLHCVRGGVAAPKGVMCAAMCAVETCGVGVRVAVSLGQNPKLR